MSIIREGVTVETGTLADLRHLTRTVIDAAVAGHSTGLDDIAGVHDLEVKDLDGLRTRVRCQVDALHLADVLKCLTDLGVSSLTSRPPDLEDLFLRHYATPPSVEHAEDAEG